MRTALVWFRRDLRVHDHPALTAATGARGRRPVPARRRDYPAPIVDHRRERERALARYRAVTG